MTKDIGIPTIHDVSYLNQPLLAMLKDANSFRGLHETVLRTRRRIRSEERVSLSFDENNGFPEYFKMWTQTVRILRELMVLQLIERQEIPNQPPDNMNKLEEVLNIRFQLTKLGSDLAVKIDKQSDDLGDALLDIIRKRHPAFERFVNMLQSNDMIRFPEMSVPRKEPGVQFMVSRFVESFSKEIVKIMDMNEYGNAKLTTEKVLSHLKTYLGENFINSKDLNRTQIAALVHKLNQGIKVLLLKKLDLDLGVPSLDVSINWSRQFQIGNFARGLQQKPGFVTYSTARVIFQNHMSVHRRTKEIVRDIVISDIPVFFQKLKTPGSPWASIYPLRAEVCFKNRINDGVFDDIIRDIYFQRLAVPYKISLESDLWATPPPSTRPLLLYEQQRRNIISVFAVKE